MQSTKCINTGASTIEPSMLAEIPLDEPISVAELHEIVKNSSRNDIPLGSDHVVKRRVKDLFSKLLEDGLEESDKVILTRSFKEGCTYVGDLCRVAPEEYCPVWYLRSQ